MGSQNFRRNYNRLTRKEKRVLLYEKLEVDIGVVMDDFAESAGKSHVSRRPDPKTSWEGPRFDFLSFLGTRERWDGPKQSDCCHGRKLDQHEYCLMCDRSGLDRLIPKPTEADARRRRSAYRMSGGLKGGRK